MIDSSRSPRPLWKRTLTATLLVIGIATLAWLIWIKELHHRDIRVHAFAAPAAALTNPTPIAGAA